MAAVEKGKKGKQYIITECRQLSRPSVHWKMSSVEKKYVMNIGRHGPVAQMNKNYRGYSDRSV